MRMPPDIRRTGTNVERKVDAEGVASRALPVPPEAIVVSYAQVSAGLREEYQR